MTSYSGKNPLFGASNMMVRMKGLAQPSASHNNLNRFALYNTIIH
jgi:hypothetical protein